MVADSQQRPAAPHLNKGPLPAPVMNFANQPRPNRDYVPPLVQGGANSSGVGHRRVSGTRSVGGMERERRGSAPNGGHVGLRDDPQGLHEMQHQLQYNKYGPASLPSQPSMTNQPLPAAVGQPAGQPRPPLPLDTQREMMLQKEQSGDILTPGIDSQVHDMAQGLIAEMEEGGGENMTGTPYDPNLTCIYCQKMFRVGEIQLYRSHTTECGGSSAHY